MRLTARVVTVLTASLLAVGTLTVPAHAASPVLVSSSPAAGSTTKTKPSSVSLTFDQAVATSSTITVTAPPGTSPCTKSTQTAPSTTISCTFTGLPQATVNDGTYTVSYVAKSTGTDPDGTGSFQFVLDTVAPSAPTGLAISPSPYLAASETLTVTGASEQASDSVRVSLSGGSSVSRTVSPAADKSFSAVFTAAEVAGLSDGTVTASATSTDVAGNTGPAATRTVVKDSARPTIVSTDPADGGSKKPASFAYTVNASETLASSSRVDLFDATQTQIAVATSVTSSTVKATPGALPDGAYTAKIHLVDVNGNTGNPGGAPSVRTFTIDNTAPASPSITTPLAPINRSNQAAYPVAGTGEARAVVTVRVGSATKTVTVAGDGTWSTPVDTSALSDGSVSVTATQTDAAGNVSPVSSTASTFKDTVAPAITGQAVTPARMGSATLVATVTGSVNDGGGPLPPAGSESDVPVTLTADDTDPTTAPVVVEGRTNSSGGFSLQVDTSTLSDGTISYRAVATDAAGNPSPAVSVSNTKNTVPPGMPTVAISPKPINNANKAAITVSGSTTGTSVSITLTDGTTTIGPFTPTVSGGTYSQSVNTTALADGIVTASVVPRDAAGNTGPTGTAEAVKDTGVPSAPTSVAVPQYLTSGTLPVSGRAEPGSTVTVVVSDSASTPATATRSVAVPTDGAWELSVNVSALADGVLTLSVKAADAAGNVSPATSPAPETFKDTVAPDRPASLSATPSPYIPSSTTFTVAGTTSDADRSTSLTVDITVADTDPATADLTVKNVAVTPGALPLSPGSFSHAFSSTQIRTLRDGALTVTAVLHDRAGNASAARTATAVKDTTLLALVATAPDTAPSGAGGTVEGLTNNASRTSATFNEAITPTTHPAETRSTITIKNRNNVTVAGVGSVSGETITFTPSSPLSDAG
uniref:Ig-like domain-containing protein n=1 Tax=Nocardioides sp. TaxID=35761 RepID=UPI003567B35E